MDVLGKLKTLRGKAGQRLTQGLSDETITRFAGLDAKLSRAVDEAARVAAGLTPAQARLVLGDESTLIESLQSDILNFYDPEGVNPYVPLAGKGPWIVTAHGAVVHDSGGYGMVGLGHEPEKIQEILGRPHVMANVMTPSFADLEFTTRLHREIGSRHRGAKPYTRFICLNSGSEAMGFALRLSDANAHVQLQSAGHRGKKPRFCSLKGSFHGRTDRPAQASGSTRKNYDALPSFAHTEPYLVEPNDVGDLEKTFATAARDGVFIEALLIEPVMGEGDPGMAISRPFYDAARRITKANGALLIIDSIQAGLRAWGCLSIVDYPGFEDSIPPDLETFSKALNAGQYPLSVVGISEHAAALYTRGLYGNTMTANPMALEVACAVLDSLTPELRANIVARGREFLQKFEGLRQEFPEIIQGVRGQGLLFAVHINPKIYDVVGKDGLEKYLRIHGIGVVHGGANALRLTPHFAITSLEIDLIVAEVRQALRDAPRKKA